jgi:hypothetical protein
LQQLLHLVHLELDLGDGVHLDGLAILASRLVNLNRYQI